MKKIVLSLLCILAASPALAVNKIYTPYVTQGEWELEYFAHRSIDNDDARDNEQKHEFSVGYGVTDAWKTELYGIFEKAPQDHLKFDAVEWENIFQFTEKKEYWLDAGAALAYEWTPESSRADAVEARLLLAKELGPTFHVLNLIGEKEVGAGPKAGFESALLWSSRYRYNAYIEPGFELHSEFGEVDNIGAFDDQQHYLGPVIYGTIPWEVEGDEIEGLHYRAGYLFGLTNQSNDGEVVLELEYELEF